MKKIFPILLLIILSILNCSKRPISSDLKNDLSYYRLNGKVKSIRTELFNLIIEKDTFRIGEKINSVSMDRNYLMEFDQFGNITSSTEFLSNGKIKNETKYIYDNIYRLIRKQEIDNYGKGSLNIHEYKYNSKDSIIGIVLSNDNFKDVKKMERDEKNRLAKMELFHNDTIFSTYTFKYDQKDNIIEENILINKRVPSKLIERTFNLNNLKEKEQVVEFNAWDTLFYENRFFYDTNKNLIREEHNIVNESNYEEIINTYHKNGKLKESKSIPKGSSLFKITTRKFNEYGDLIEFLREPNNDKLKNVWNYKYMYDSKNNWIEKFVFKDGEPLEIVKRTIEYYK